VTVPLQIIVVPTVNLFLENIMKDDPRCCGTGTCIINNEGYCWCGQRWDGEKMCFDRSDNANVAGSLPMPEVTPTLEQPAQKS
jgi:hypothetical protein